MSSANTLPHIVVVSEELWGSYTLLHLSRSNVDQTDDNKGHVRPLCFFVSRLVLTQEVHVTLLTFPSVLSRVKNEISRAFNETTAERQKLIRYATLYETIKMFKPDNMSFQSGHDG